MDEPLSALDKKLREQMQIEVRQLHERLGMTTVYVTHDQREALTMSDRVAVIDRGRIRQIGRPRDVYERPQRSSLPTSSARSHFLPVSRPRRDSASYSGQAVCGLRSRRAIRPASNFWRHAAREAASFLDGAEAVT